MDLVLLHLLLTQPEGERLEFKEWKRKSDVEALHRYCCALANEGGGYLVIGVTDRRPRRIVGTAVFPALDDVVARVREQVGIAVHASAVMAGGQRVVVFTVPSRPRGEPVLYQRVIYCRQGESLVPMPPDRLGAILDERGDEPTLAGGDTAVTLTLDAATTPRDFLRHYRRVAHEHNLPVRLFDHHSLTAVDGQLALTPAVRLYLPQLLATGLVQRDPRGSSSRYQLTARGMACGEEPGRGAGW